MPVGDVPELDYIADCILADLADISTSKKAKAGAGSPFYTDIATVGEPDYHYNDTQRIMLEKPPAALLFTFGMHSDPKSNSHERRPIARVLILLYVAAPINVNRSGPRFESDVQRKGRRLWDDVDRVMMGNPMRNHPQAAGATNDYGVLTWNTDNASWEPQQPAAGLGQLVIPCFYDITYRAKF